MQFFVYFLHTYVGGRDNVGALFKLAHNGVGVVNVLFVFHSVLEARPKIHCNGAELNLNLNIFLSVREKKRVSKR